MGAWTLDWTDGTKVKKCEESGTLDLEPAPSLPSRSLLEKKSDKSAYVPFEAAVVHFLVKSTPAGDGLACYEPEI